MILINWNLKFAVYNLFAEIHKTFVFDNLDIWTTRNENSGNISSNITCIHLTKTKMKKLELKVSETVTTIMRKPVLVLVFSLIIKVY